MTIKMTPFLIVCFALALPSGAATIRVPADQPTIQAGIDAALDGDTVLVADGTWSGPGNIDLDFGGRAITVRSENGAAACTIDCQRDGRGFIFQSGEGNDSIVDGFTIIRGDADPSGGGILCTGASPTITRCDVVSCLAWPGGGGGIALSDSSAVISHTIFRRNESMLGGGVCCGDGSGTPVLFNCLITQNYGWENGGGLFVAGTAPELYNCTLAANNAKTGTAITDWLSANQTRVIDSIVRGTGSPVEGSIRSRYSCLPPGVPGGDGVIHVDPKFVSGPGGDYYLSQTAAGQLEQSLCVDAADPTSPMTEGTTRTDEVPDSGRLDMGYHYPVETAGISSLLVVGLGPAPENPPRVRIFPPQQDATRVGAFQAYGAPHYGVTVTTGDMDGDQSEEIITGPGPGPIYGPHVRGFTVAGGPLPGLSFLAYATHKYGVNVAAGDFDADGYDEIITGAGPGAVFAPHVRGWDYDGSGSVTPAPGVSFFAYATPKWGVNVASGDIDGDGFDEIVTGAGPGAVYGAHVRGWNVDGGTAAAIPGVSYFAYGTPRYGVRVACGDIDGDGLAEIVTAPGPSPAFGSHIRGWNFDGSSISPMEGVSFFAWEPGEARYGASVFSGADLDGDGRDEIVVGAGPDPAVDTLVKAFSYDGSGVTLWFSLQAFPDGWTHGAGVAAGRF